MPSKPPAVRASPSAAGASSPASAPAAAVDETDAESRAAPAPSVGLIVGVLVLASSTSIMSTDMYAPSLPDLVGYFATTPERVQLTISLNMLAFGLAQLLHGPLSDRFGRRPVLVGSLLAVTLLALGCALAQSIGQLIVARVALGLVAAAEAVVGLAVIKDLYEEKRQIRAFALLGMVIAVAPAVAPIAGGYLHVAFGWQSNFVVIAAMALVSAALIARLLPESTRPDPSALEPARIARGYARLFANGDFLVHTAMLGMAMGLILVFVTGAPFVLIEQLGVAVERFGWYQAAIVLAFFLGSSLAARVAERWAGERMLVLGVALIGAGAGVLALVALGGALSPWRFAGSYALMTLGMGFLFAVAPSRALRSIDGQAGTASALLTGIEQTTAACAAVAVSVLHDGSARPITWLTLALAFALVVLCRRALASRPAGAAC